MREIKFRCFNAFANVMQSWEDMVNLNKIHLLANQKPSYQIMQFTGLKDINGKDIYEGDILADDCIRKELYDEGTYAYGVVLFKDGKFLQAYTHKDNSVYYDDVTPIWLKIKVVGNIYENPEILGENQ